MDLSSCMKQFFQSGGCGGKCARNIGGKMSQLVSVSHVMLFSVMSSQCHCRAIVMAVSES